MRLSAHAVISHKITALYHIRDRVRILCGGHSVADKSRLRLIGIQQIQDLRHLRRSRHSTKDKRDLMLGRLIALHKLCLLRVLRILILPESLVRLLLRVIHDPVPGIYRQIRVLLTDLSGKVDCRQNAYKQKQ